jgi:hypothetical protein
MKAGAPSLQPTRLIDQVREQVRNMHYRLNIVNCCLFGKNYFLVRQAMG